jgi:glycosyltransferase involved in cell wall biosynthesis
LQRRSRTGAWNVSVRVSFDSQIFCLQKYGGISRYFASLAREMNAMPGVDARVVAPLYVNEYLGELPRGIVTGKKVEGRAIPKPLLCVASSLAGEIVLVGTKSDVVHETYYYPQLRGPRRSKRVVSVYDMNYEKYPGLFPKNDSMPKWKRRAVETADHVICISENTRRDLLEFCSVAEERVSITYLGYDPLSALLPGRPAAEDGRQEKPYLLYVGSRSGCKNFAALLEAIASSAWLKQGFNLMCFGGGEFAPGERATIDRLGLSSSIIQMSGSDSSLAACYRDAALFVYPSLHEGFGIPPLEAMSLDCPVVCSNASSIPEVVGDAAVMFNPADTDDIRKELEAVLNSASLRETLIARGRLRCRVFSWERCARETMAIYEKILAA